jgi:hypothetical protein
MTTSASTNYVPTRDDIIKRALRIIGALGQGETPPAQAVTEASQALNDLMKEWMADGMHLWKYQSKDISLTIGQSTYLIGEGQAINIPCPNKIVQASRRTGWDTNISDIPLILMTKEEQFRIPNKQQSGTPTHLLFRTQQNDATANPGTVGVITLWPVPDANFVASQNGILRISYMRQFDDFDASGNNPDIPPYYFNALVWGLADQLAYEYGLGPVDKSQINKKAMQHKSVALSFDQEEGSLYIIPDFEKME